MTTPTHEQHAVLVNLKMGYGRDFTLVRVFTGTWDAAQSVWKALTDAESHLALEAVPEVEGYHFSVRSMDDPVAKLAYTASGRSYSPTSRVAHAAADALYRDVQYAERAYEKATLGKLALAAVKDESLTTLGAVVAEVRRLATDAGLNPNSFDSYYAVKSRVHMGRTHESPKDRRAYFVPKSFAKRLYDVRTPDGVSMSATSSAFQGEFTRLTRADLAEGRKVWAERAAARA